MIEELSTSFPYFHISRILDVPYAEVLKWVDYLDKFGLMDPVFQETKLLYTYVEHAWLLEQKRRTTV